MKKMIAIVLTILVITSMLCVPAIADDAPASDIVLRVSGIKSDGTTEKVEDYKIFDDGWNAAMELANNSGKMKEKSYIRVVVDLCADWNAVDGQFTDERDNGSGFNRGTIYFQSDVRMTFNLNGHTINRRLTEDEMHGEVMYIDEKADIVIKNGTITGGFSNNGAGGIYINDGAKVVLENVNVVGNSVENDNGAAIAVYNGAKLTVKCGSISGNTVICNGDDANHGTVYVEESTAIFTGVTFSKNEGPRGAVVHAYESTVTLNDCIVENNEKRDAADQAANSSIFYSADGILNIHGSEIKNNGSAKNAAIFEVDGIFNMTDCKVMGNHTDAIFLVNNGGGFEVVSSIHNCNFFDNEGLITVQYTDPKAYKNREMVFDFTNCEFNNNDADRRYGYSFYADQYVDISLIDCKIGNTTFCNKQFIDFGRGEGVGSMFSEGSLAMILSFVALIASAAAIAVHVSSKKQAVPTTATANNTAKNKE